MKDVKQIKLILLLITCVLLFVKCKENEIDKAILNLKDENITISNIDKKTIWNFNYKFGEKRVNSSVLNEVTKDLLKTEYKNLILSIDLYISFNKLNLKEWNIFREDIKNIGIYYLKDNKIMFDYFELQKAKITLSANKLSDVYCDAVIPFLFENSNLKKEELSLITLSLNKSEVPNYSTLNLSTKENDTIYSILRKTVDKYKKK